MAFTLPALPYAFDALEPHIDSTTMQIHHGKHHQAYIDNLNKAIGGTPNEGKSLEELVAKAGSISPAVRIRPTKHAGDAAHLGLHPVFLRGLGRDRRELAMLGRTICFIFQGQLKPRSDQHVRDQKLVVGALELAGIF